jgi:prepilin-type N-terminal cleavage/methylation domain-containing protein/prepilin-type processing-associated H-X9-DG protein
MTTRTHTPRKGFTLIELLTVIAIIGILASILIPSIGAVITNAHRTASSSNASQIAKSYLAYANSGPGGNIRNIRSQGEGGVASGVAASLIDVATILAQKEGLNDGTMWYVAQDPNLGGKPIPSTVITGDPNAATPTVNTEFQSTTPHSWAFAVNLSTNAPGTTTPVIWTYGLTTAGTWSPGTGSPWSGAGGHIAFLDGHVSWYEQLFATDAQGPTLTTYETNSNPGQATQDISQAINNTGTSPAVIYNQTGSQ